MWNLDTNLTETMLPLDVRGHVCIIKCKNISCYITSSLNCANRKNLQANCFNIFIQLFQAAKILYICTLERKDFFLALNYPYVKQETVESGEQGTKKNNHNDDETIPILKQ